MLTSTAVSTKVSAITSRNTCTQHARIVGCSLPRARTGIPMPKSLKVNRKSIKCTAESKQSSNGSSLAVAAAAALATGLIAQVEPSLAADVATDVAEVLGTPAWVIWLEYLVLAGGYLVVAPIGIYFYLTKRWFKRGSWETVFQFSLVFLFFPGIFLASPFLNFRPENVDDITDESFIM
mmetsp:Transcript_28720/g.39688  ORF Transcript_28720/g.39688 Transcript_28720/m.39688 type:complete len:179 (+) Transcript_28720:98-634(+)